MATGDKLFSGEIMIDGEVVGYSVGWSVEAPPAVNLTMPEEAPDAMTIAEARQRVLDYLAENMGGGTEEELREAIGYDGNILGFGAMINIMIETGQLTVAHVQREAYVKWHVRADMAQLPNGQFIKTPETVEHIERRPIVRLSPQQWIELVS